MTNRLRVLRAELKVSQEQVAADLKLHKQTIFSVETGKYAPSVIIALKIAKYFNKPIEEIFQLEESD